MATTVVNIRRGEPYDVFIGRPSKWGNPFRIGLYRSFTREDAIQAYRDWLPAQIALGRLDPAELKGKRLGCYCAPQACHGDVLAALADTPRPGRAGEGAG